MTGLAGMLAVKGLVIVAMAVVGCGLTAAVPVHADTIVAQYSTDGRNWVSGGSYTVTKDTTVYGRVYNSTKGTASATRSVRVLVDKAAPARTAVSYGKNGVWTNSPPAVSWSSSDTGGSGLLKYQYWRSDMGSWSDYGTGTSWVPEQNKQFTMKWRAVDRAGNIGAESTTITVKTDNVAPGLTSAVTPTGWTRQVVATANASDVSKVQYQFKKGSTVVTGFGGTKSWTLTANGGYTVLARDEAGNVSSRAVTVSNVDRVAPNGSCSVDKGGRNKTDVRLKLWDDLSNVAFVVLPNGTKWYPGVSG